MTRSVRQVVPPPQAVPTSEPAQPDGDTAVGDPRRPLCKALSRTLDEAPIAQSTFLGRRARLLAIGVALEQRVGPEGYEAALRGCEAMLAGLPRPMRGRPSSPNQLALPFAAAPAVPSPEDSAAPPVQPAPFRSRPARRRWR